MISPPVWKIKTFADLSAEELYLILSLRQEVFVVEQTCAYQDADGHDQAALHVWAEVDCQIAAYCRIFAPGIKYAEASIGRVLTHSNYRGKNLGKKLMTVTLAAIQTRYDNAAIRISAQDYLLSFYGEFGFQSTKKHYLEDEIPHTEMLRLGN